MYVTTFRRARDSRIRTVFLFLCVCAVAGSFSSVRPVSAGIYEAVQVCESKDDLIYLMQAVRGTEADGQLALDLALWLRGGTRWFERGGAHSDPIDGVTVRNGRVLMTYRRDGKRWGWAEMTAHRMGDYSVLVGDWYQASKMRGGSFTTPAVPLPGGGVIPSLPIPFGVAFRDDHGGIIYLFSGAPGSYRSAGGVGIDFGDSKCNPNWLEGE